MYKIYDLKCSKCGQVDEHMVRGRSDQHLVHCIHCGQKNLHRVMPSAPAFQVTGAYDGRMKV